MEKYNLPYNLKVFGNQVKTFPMGVGEAFDKLIEMLPSGDKRTFYGLSECKNGEILYFATAEETFDGEAEKYNGCQTFLICQGEYLTITVKDWLKKTECIKDVFADLMKEPDIDLTKPCVERYINDDEMVCMMKLQK